MAHENDWVINGDIPYRLNFPSMNESENIGDKWVTITTRGYINPIDRWTSKTWLGDNLIYGKDVWRDELEDKTYYSFGTRHYVLEKSTSTWVEKTWRGLTSFYGEDIWADGTDIYMSKGNNTYKLDRSNHTWSSYAIANVSVESGKYVWHDNDKTYYSDGSSHYYLDIANQQWLPVPYEWSYMFDGDTVWHHKNEIYSSDNGTNYAYDHDTNVWSPISAGSFPARGSYVWHAGGHTFWTVGSWTYHYDEETRTFSVLDYTYKNIYGDAIWTDGETVYHSNGSSNSQKELLKDEISDIPYRMQFPALNASRNFGHEWLINNDIPYRYQHPELKESFNVGGEWLAKDEPDTSSTKKYLKLTHTITVTLTAGNRTPTITYTLPSSNYVTAPEYTSPGYNSWSYIQCRIMVPANAKVYRDNWELSNSDICNIFDPDNSNYFLESDGYHTMPVDVTGQQLFYDSGEYSWAYPSRDYGEYGTNAYYMLAKLSMLRQLTPSESGSTTITFSHIFEFDSENDDYRAFLASYPNNVEPWYPMRQSVPFRLDFPPFNSSIPGSDIWLIDDDYPYRVDFPQLRESSGGATSWLQDKGWDPRRPWPNHRSIIQKVQTIPNIPEVDWTKSMQQTFEFYTVDPNTWYDDTKLENIISCDITHDLTSDKRGNASITISEPLPECYIRTYLVVTQAGFVHKICLGTYLYMTSSDSFDGMKHNITMTGYTPMVELEEKLPPLGFHIVGITNRKHSGDAPMVTDAIKDIVTTYTRCEIENRTIIQKPLLNDFVAGTNDTFLAVINNILDASSLQQYILTVDEWGTIIVKDKPVLEDAIPTYIYTDDNSSILLPSLDTNDDIYGIPNVIEVLYTGDKRLPAIRVIVKNEDPTSIVSIQARGREIAKRYTITNIAAPANDYSEAAVRAQVTDQAERLLEAASTIQKTISYSHGYCDVKVGDTVLINYERAGMINVRAKVVSQKISCKPGCQVDEQAVYTKKLWNRGV